MESQHTNDIKPVSEIGKGAEGPVMLVICDGQKRALKGNQTVLTQDQIQRV